MTRQRMRKSLHTTNTQPCVYCSGKGSIKSNFRIAIDALHKIETMVKNHKNLHVECTVTPEVAEILLKSTGTMVKGVEKKYKCKISILVDTSLQPEEMRLKRVLDKRKFAWLTG